MDLNLKELLQIVVVPATGGLVTLLWPHVQASYKSRKFTQLIARELREVEPFPEGYVAGSSWSAHAKKVYLHQKIFRDPSQNRDFLLTIDPTLAYNVSQLWESLANGDSIQWLRCVDQLTKMHDLNKVAKKDPNAKLSRTNKRSETDKPSTTDKLTANYKKWERLIQQHDDASGRSSA